MGLEFNSGDSFQPSLIFVNIGDQCGVFNFVWLLNHSNPGLWWILECRQRVIHVKPVYNIFIPHLCKTCKFLSTTNARRADCSTYLLLLLLLLLLGDKRKDAKTMA